jgi:hypothetical protein
MLQMVKKRFEIDAGRIVKPGEIVDTTGWNNADYLINSGYLMDTDAKKPTEAFEKKKPKTSPVVSAAPANNQPAKKAKRSVLAGHKRVFTRKAKQGV